MIITKKIEITLRNSNIGRYRINNPNLKVGEKIEIPIDSLPKSSNIKITISCDICNSEKSASYNEYNRYISRSTDGLYRCKNCVREVSKLTKLEKYGDENYTNREKYKKTNLEKYGGHFNKLTEFKNKIKETNVKKYGSEYPILNDEVRQKRTNTMMSRYGKENVFQVEELRDKMKETMINKYGHEYSMQIDSISKKITNNSKIKKIEKIKNSNLDIIDINYVDNIYTAYCNICNSEFEIKPHIYNLRKKYNTILCSNCNKIDRGSGLESKLLEIIKNNYNGEIQLNKRNIIPPYEIDIYLPDKKIGFEMNGIYWHSNLFKENDYHLKKTKMCEDRGITLFQIWDDDFIKKREIIESMIKSKLGNLNRIYARKCEIRNVSKKDENKFIEENHIQGYAKSKINLGLFYKDELVCIMTFSKPRKIYKGNGNVDYELIRFCNKINTNVIGGASKLFQSFIKSYNPKIILTFADRFYSNGNLYNKLNFSRVGETKPNYQYILNGRRVHRFSLRKSVLVDKFNADPSLTEDEITSMLLIYKVYNSGNIKYLYYNS